MESVLWRMEKVKLKLLGHVRFFATPWTVAHQASPSMEFSRQEYWSGLPFPSPEDLPHPGIEPRSPTLQADAFIIWAMKEVFEFICLRHTSSNSKLKVIVWTVSLMSSAYVCVCFS